MRSLLAIAVLGALAACAPHAPATATSAAPAPSIDIAGLLDAHSNVSGVLSPDGTRLAFRSDRGGAPGLYVADVARPDAPARQLLGGPERIASIGWLGDGKTILVRRDHSADESFAIWAVAADGSAPPANLTPDDALWRDLPFPVPGDDQRFVYSARKPDDLASMIFVQALGGAPRLVFRDTTAAAVVDVAPGGHRALWYREVKTGGHDILEVDLDRGAARPVEPRDGRPTMATAAAYAADGARIFVATDLGGEDHVVLALDARTLREVARYTQRDPATAQIASIAVSPRGDRLAITINAGNHATVRLLDATTLAAVGDVATPLGTAGVGQFTEIALRLAPGVFSRDGARFVLELSTADAPTDLFLVDTASAAITPARREPRPALARLPPIATSIARVHSFDGLEVPVNVYVPRQAAGRVPAILWLHGGPDQSTSIEWDPTNRVLAAAGYAVLEPNIRGSTGFGRAYASADDHEKRWNALRDLAAVHAWARAQPWCNGDLVVTGGSMGGYYTLMALAHQPDLWRAGVDLAGPSDLRLMVDATSAPRNFEEFGDPATQGDLLDALSPIRAVDHIRAPLFVYQGEQDHRAPRVHADRVVAALRKRGAPVEYMLVADEGHTMARRANQVAYLTRVLAFLARSLAR
ncbi:MAG TPA: prolyl oligopeptidase family serine peptidase [Kofleriaceae bacterium]|nr:prolyl oligopeptidase family serine peptidase [Kofleriaceae bacterium]